MSGCGRGEIEVRNKPSRVAELITALDELLDKGAVVPATLPSTLGRLQFAEMQITGRAGRLAMADVRDLGHTSKVETMLEPSAVEAFKLLRYRLGNSRPRTLKVLKDCRPVVVHHIAQSLGECSGLVQVYSTTKDASLLQVVELFCQ